MKIFANLKIGTRLIIGFSFVFLVMIGNFIYSEVVFSKSENQLKESTETFEKIKLTNEIVGRIHEISRIIRNLAIVQDLDEAEEEIEGIYDRREYIKENAVKLEKLLTSSEEKKLFSVIKEKRGDFVGMQEKLIQLHKEGNKTEYLRVLLEDTRPVQQAYFKSTAKLIEHLQKEMEKDEKVALEQIKFSKTVQLIAIIAAVLIGIFFVWYIIRSITKPLSRCLQVAEKIAEGDLTDNEEIEVTNDEVGAMARAINKMELSLKSAINKISDSSLQVSSAAIQLHSTSEQMATSSEELTAQSNNVATASEEMAATAADIARNCHLAADTSNRASNTATQGAQVVALTVDAMNRISQRVKSTAVTISTLGTRSEQIGEIVGTIEDIADQTNLLALNAAIEAARAGEMGRGFAVVADEVRALAERTTKATKEISDMIRTIQKETGQAVSAMEEGVNEVEKGTNEAMKSGSAIEEILSAIDEVTQQINQIATAAEEQSATTNEITSNVSQITEVSMQNSQGAQESSASAEELSRLANELKLIVSKFKLS